uniref:Uncharacterized protein n=1 Tax=Lepeophtheirus salmonis TaxID=72036 RepID=A0A0K2T1F4_LEPSM
MIQLPLHHAHFLVYLTKKNDSLLIYLLTLVSSAWKFCS